MLIKYLRGRDLLMLISTKWIYNHIQKSLLLGNADKAL